MSALAFQINKHVLCDGPLIPPSLPRSGGDGGRKAFNAAEGCSGGSSAAKPENAFNSSSLRGTVDTSRQDLRNASPHYHAPAEPLLIFSFSTEGGQYDHDEQSILYIMRILRVLFCHELVKTDERLL